MIHKINLLLSEKNYVSVIWVTKSRLLMQFRVIITVCYEDCMKHQIKSVGKMRTLNLKTVLRISANGVKIFVMK